MADRKDVEWEWRIRREERQGTAELKILHKEADEEDRGETAGKADVQDRRLVGRKVCKKRDGVKSYTRKIEISEHQMSQLALRQRET
jgi:hypothetical protein